MPDYSQLTPNQIIDIYLTQDVKELEMTRIRLDLANNGVLEEDILIVLRIIGNEKLKVENRKMNTSNGKQFIIAGFVFILIGVLITAVTYNNALHKGGGTYILMFGPILGGIGLLLHGNNLRS